MMIVNFFLFLICFVTFALMGLSFVFGMWWLSFFFALLFGLVYYAMRLDHKKVTQPKEYIINHVINGVPSVEDDSDDWGLSNLNTWNRN